MRRLVALLVATAFIAASCGSGPTPAVEARGLVPTTTTTTEPLPEGLVIVKIRNASFSPQIVELDLDKFHTVRWVNEDADVEYIVQERRETFVSPPLKTGDEFEVDFRGEDLGPKLWRYETTRGLQRITGTIDARPSQ